MIVWPDWSNVMDVWPDFVLINYDTISHVMSILSVHITDVYRQY